MSKIELRQHWTAWPRQGQGKGHTCIGYIEGDPMTGQRSEPMFVTCGGATEDHIKLARGALEMYHCLRRNLDALENNGPGYVVDDIRNTLAGVEKG